ncbi:hypothetical protein KSS87_008153, partial [Heliosperma pusillum]
PKIYYQLVDSNKIYKFIKLQQSNDSLILLIIPRLHIIFNSQKFIITVPLISDFPVFLGTGNV